MTLERCCREVEGGEQFEDDPWRSKEFYVKWKRWSYIHCSWDTRETLSQLGGYKRLMNYMKRQVPSPPPQPAQPRQSHASTADPQAMSLQYTLMFVLHHEQAAVRLYQPLCDFWGFNLRPLCPQFWRRAARLCPQDALELSKRDMAPEEVELLDVERQMEEDLVEEFKQVERVIATRVDAVEGDQRYLVKVSPWRVLTPRDRAAGLSALL